MIYKLIKIIKVILYHDKGQINRIYHISKRINILPSGKVSYKIIRESLKVKLCTF